jgi:hypothetical protein
MPREPTGHRDLCRHPELSLRVRDSDAKAGTGLAVTITCRTCGRKWHGTALVETGRVEFEAIAHAGR